MFANPAGYNIIICHSNESLLKEIDSIQTLISNRINSILIFISVETKYAEHFNPILISGIPLVQFDKTIKNVSSGKIFNADFQGAFQNVKHLIDNRYKTIAHFAGPQYSISYKKCFDWNRHAFFYSKLPFQKKTIIRWSYKSGEKKCYNG